MENLNENFTGKEGGKMTLESARAMTKRYRQEEIKSKGISEEEVIRGIFFGCDHIQSLLKLPQCKGIRFYYGINSKNEKQLIMVGVREDRSNILPGKPVGKDGTDDEDAPIIDNGKICPPFCDSTGNDL